MSVVVSIGTRPVYASETITVSSTPIGPTATKLLKSASDNYASETIKVKSAFFSVETAGIRVNFDQSVTVTATTNGHVFGAGESFTVDGYETIKQMKMIAQSADATVRVTYFG